MHWNDQHLKTPHISPLQARWNLLQQLMVQFEDPGNVAHQFQLATMGHMTIFFDLTSWGSLSAKMRVSVWLKQKTRGSADHKSKYLLQGIEQSMISSILCTELSPPFHRHAYNPYWEREREIQNQHVPILITINGLHYSICVCGCCRMLHGSIFH